MDLHKYESVCVYASYNIMGLRIKYTNTNSNGRNWFFQTYKRQYHEQSCAYLLAEISK